MFTQSFHILIIVLALMAVLMMAVPLPKKDDCLRGYMFSRWMLALSFIALAVYCYFKGRMQLELMSPIFLFMANLQACLLALSHINLIHPQRVTNRYVILHFVPMAICLAAYGVIRIFSPHVALTSYEALLTQWTQPEVIVRLIWMAQYIVIYFYFMAIFVRETQRWQSMAAEFFADEKMINVKLIRTSFILLLGIGLITFGITSSLIPTLSAVLNIAIMLFYIVVGIIFLYYPRLFLEMKPVLYEPKGTTANQKTINEKRWLQIREEIISKQLYLKKGITLEQIAHEVGVSRTTLSSTLNQAEGMNFNAFINRLRILEAQRLMREDKEGGLSMQKIAEQVGYTEQSNFARQFKHWSGKTPREWRMS